MIGKRIFDLMVAIPALILLSPLMMIVAIWIKLDSNGPVIFRQKRVGRAGIPFDIFKFRTMTDSRSSGDLLITATSDSRITRIGKVLRKLKLDELPQFVNVVLGQMSVVGPRPEVGKYVELYPESSRKKILSVRPGITDNAALLFRNESDLLANADDPETEYIEKVLPAKIASYESYIDNQSLKGDFFLIFKTLRSVFFDR
jgi:lipopolysaccharide/colanic/teichoic acid biosynthesis glycosyltransferase